MWLGLWLLVGVCKAQTGEWKVYASYHNATKAVKTDARIFVLANGGLYSYDTEDQTLEGYTKANVLSDFGIKDIAYSTTAKRLIVLYENGNIDLIGLNLSSWNMPDLKNKTLSDRTVNELMVVGDEALISMNAGLALVNLQKGYFVDFYTFDSAVKQATIVDGSIYVKLASGVKQGDRKSNLLDQSNWVEVASNKVSFGLTEEEQTAATKTLEQVKDIVPDAPKENWSYQLHMAGNRLLVAGGNFYYPNTNHTGCVMCYENGRWSAFDEEGPVETEKPQAYRNVTDVVQDPADAEHHWVGTVSSGLYEFRNKKFVKHYDSDNSPLKSILPESSTYYRYIWTTGLSFDPQGNLWMLCNQTDSVVRILKKDGKWIAHYYKDIAAFETFDHTVFDQRGWAWITSRRMANYNSVTGTNSLAGVLVVNTNGTLENQKDDQHKFFYQFKNQNGETYTPETFFCVTEDLNGAIWLGNNFGVFMTETPEEVFNSNFTFTQPIVPRNDGSGLGDYLLSGVPVKCITIDGGNRKWVGTRDNGVYLLSADGMETLEHFTKENSPLISNEINDIAINGETGEVFIATYAGLCSYQGDATDPATSMSSSNLKVFPNPVRPDYEGSVHITGLMYNSNVKIVSAAGKLVAEGTSVGGEFSWNCCHQNGRRVSSGIYYALCTDENGKKGAVAKILVIK